MTISAHPQKITRNSIDETGETSTTRPAIIEMIAYSTAQPELGRRHDSASAITPSIIQPRPTTIVMNTASACPDRSRSSA